MKVGTRLAGLAPAEIAESARRAERLGFDTTSSAETNHNPFLPLSIAAEHTQNVELRTSIALAFARSPMDVAYIGWDLQAMSGGRFTLGLGSQVRGHIVRRFSMNWTAPAPRMREYIQALRHIWNAWQTGERVRFHGDHYDFNLMPPFFNPGSIANPDVKVYISAVNPYMLRVAGEVCDGVLLHGFCTPKYTREVIIPNLKIGADRAGRFSGRDRDKRGRIHHHRGDRGRGGVEEGGRQGADFVLRLNQELRVGHEYTRLGGYCRQALSYVGG